METYDGSRAGGLQLEESHINPFEYLRDILERLPKMQAKDIRAVTPAAWAKAQRASQTLRAAA